MNTKEIEARHELDERLAKGGALRTTISSRILREDRAALLAEVKRLKALCGKARPYVYHFVPAEPLTDEQAQVNLLAELREASK